MTAGSAWIGLGLIAGVLGACVGERVPAGPGPPTEPRTATIYFPTLRLSDSRPTAVLEGRVELRDSCLWIDASDGSGSYLVLWPFGSRLDQSGGTVTVRDAAGKLLAWVGAQVRLAGGETSAPADVTGQQTPTECRRGAYWQAHEVIEAK